MNQNFSCSSNAVKLQVQLSSYLCFPWTRSLYKLTQLAFLEMPNSALKNDCCFWCQMWWKKSTSCSSVLLNNNIVPIWCFLIYLHLNINLFIVVLGISRNSTLMNYVNMIVIDAMWCRSTKLSDKISTCINPSNKI